MTADVPAVNAVTTPVLETVATAVLLLDQTPPAAVLAKVVVEPTQTAVLPVIAGTTGTAFTVIGKVLEALHPFAVTI